MVNASVQLLLPLETIIELDEHKNVAIATIRVASAMMSASTDRG